MKYRVLRGGAYCFDSRYLRTTDRDWGVPIWYRVGSGFRLVLIRRKP